MEATTKVGPRQVRSDSRGWLVPLGGMIAIVCATIIYAARPSAMWDFLGASFVLEMLTMILLKRSVPEAAPAPDPEASNALADELDAYGDAVTGLTCRFRSDPGDSNRYTVSDLKFKLRKAATEIRRLESAAIAAATGEGE